MKLPDADDHSFTLLAHRSDAFYRALSNSPKQSQNHAAIAMLRTAVRELARNDRRECAALLRDMAAALEAV